MVRDRIQHGHGRNSICTFGTRNEETGLREIDATDLHGKMVKGTELENVVILVHIDTITELITKFKYVS
jgi:hypothetical protein